MIYDKEILPKGFTTEAVSLELHSQDAMCGLLGSSILYYDIYEKRQFKKFVEFKERWEEETMFESSSSMIINNGNYLNIIGFGPIAIPWIIEDLKITNDHWFYALEQITNENPIKEENLGRVEKMTNDWLEWAEENNYV